MAAAAATITTDDEGEIGKMDKLLRPGALLLVLALLLAGCGLQPEIPEKTLYDQGRELVSLMGEMAASTPYTSLYTGDQEMAELLSGAGEWDFSAPQTVYRIRMPESALQEIAEAMDPDGQEALSDGLKAVMSARVISTLPTQLNAMGGADVLAASSICSASKSFVSSELTENTIYLYLYEKAVPAAVVFLPGEGGAVSANGTLLLNDSFGRYSLEELRGVLEKLGAEVEEITPEP